MAFEKLTVETITEGNGTKPTTGDKLHMHYVGTLAADGSEFDSSRKKDKPFRFTLGQGEVISGWDEGVAQLSCGETAKLMIPSTMGYGARGAGNGIIPPNADLIFEVELLAINNVDKDGNEFEEPGFSREVLSEGNGKDFPRKGDRLVMHYTGKLASNGKIFDCSRQKNKPFQFRIGVGQVIRGWDEGVAQMSLGEKCKLLIKSEFGYGARGAGNGLIPPNADLIFEVELIAINEKIADGYGQKRTNNAGSKPLTSAQRRQLKREQAGGTSVRGTAKRLV